MHLYQNRANGALHVCIITDHVLEGPSTAKETSDANTNSLRLPTGKKRTNCLLTKKAVKLNQEMPQVSPFTVMIRGLLVFFLKFILFSYSFNVCKR